jgi:hypothetical protein
MGDDGGWVFGIIGRLAGCVAMAAVAAYGFVRISAPRQPADNGFAHAGYAPATDAQPDTEPALDRARIHAARPADGSFRPAALRFSPLPAAGVEADTLRPRNEPTPLNRPLLLAAVPSPTLDPSRNLADGSREGPTSGIAVPSISPVLANPSVTAAPSAVRGRDSDRSANIVCTADRRGGNCTLLVRGRSYLAKKPGDGLARLGPARRSS